MDLKSIIVLTFVVGHAISINTTSAAKEIDDQKFDKNNTYCSKEILAEVFGDVFGLGNTIAKYLPNQDLKNIAKIEMLRDIANSELNRRSTILHYQNGKISPPFLARSFQRISQLNFTYYKQRRNILSQHWTPSYAILFGGEKPLNIINTVGLCTIFVVTPQEDHLKIFKNIIYGNVFVPAEIKGSPMNGVIFPHSSLSLDIEFAYLSLKQTLDDSPFVWYQSFEYRDEMKLAIIFASDDEYIQEKAKNRALITAQTMRKKLGNIPTCIVAQSDTREKNESKSVRIWDSMLLVFHGLDVSASTLVVDINDEKTLKTKFEEWKEELFFLNTHQAIAFHFTVVNGTELEKSEEIFSETFPDIPLSTLRLLGGPSITGVNYHDETKFDEKESRFDSGPVYAIVGVRKFGEDMEDSSEEID